MSVPNSRDSFKQYCLRRLGAPVIEINVDDDQVEDRIDEALKYYWDYHFDGTEKVYLKHQVTAQDKENKFIPIPENIIGAVEVFPIGDPAVRSDDLFNIRYQIALNDLYTLTSVSMVPYYMVMEHLATVTQILVGKQPVRYNRHRNRMFIDMDWNTVNVGEFLLVVAYQLIDPDEFTNMWGDRWLQMYTTALIKRQWGANLSKYSGMQLPGGLQFNGDKIYEDAVREIEKLEQEMLFSYSLPVLDMVN